MLIQNLSAVFTCEGFAKRDGRRVTVQDCTVIQGPVDIGIDDTTRTIVEIGRDLARRHGDTIDASGQIALPGFVDPHTHAIFAGERSHEYFMRWAGKGYVEITEAGGGIHSTVAATNNASDAELASSLRTRLRAMLATGATTVEVKSGYANTADGELRLLRIIKSLASEVGLPEVRPSFLALHALPKGRDESQYVNEMIAALSRVAVEKLAAHVDSFPEKGFFTLESARRFADAARRAGLPSKVHADELCDLGSSRAFIEDGALSVDHLQHIADDAVNLLAEKPTVATMLPATSFFVGIPYANARRLLDAGARVALATDFNPGTAPASDLQLTHMLAASQMKMSPWEILCGSTFNAAAALGVEKSHGVLAPGRVANVLLFDAPSVETTDHALRRWQQIIIKRHVPSTVIARARKA